MAFADRPLDALEEADLSWLCENRIQEDDRLDYKAAMYEANDDGRKELRRDITAMANQRGGRLVIGVAENDEQQAESVPGVAPVRAADWVRDVFLEGIEERIIGLRARDVPLAGGNVVVVVDVPESPAAPHRIVYRDWSQFWRRHGRRKAQMSIDEIRDGFVRVAETRTRTERFLQQQQQRLRALPAGETWLVLSALPTHFREQDVIDTGARHTRQLIYDVLMLREEQRRGRTAGQSIVSGMPFPTPSGARAEQEGAEPKYLEIHRSGYVEFGYRLDVRQEGQARYFASIHDGGVVAAFVYFVCDYFAALLPSQAITLRLTIHGANGMQLAVHRGLSGPCQQDLIEVSGVVIEDTSGDPLPTVKLLLERVFNAFRVEGADRFFDADGNIVRARLS